MSSYREVMAGVRMKLVHCDEGLVAVETLLEEGSVVPKHSHESAQLTILLRGLLLLGVEGVGERVLKPGDYALIPGGVKHWAKALESSLVLDVNWPLTRDRLAIVEKIGGECQKRGRGAGSQP